MIREYSIFLSLAFVAEIIGTVSGFGSSILFIPLASLFFDFKTVLGITAVFHVFSNVSKIFLFRNGVDKNIALKLGIPAVVFVIIGALITTRIQTQVMDLLMSVALLVLSVFLLFNMCSRIEQSNFNLVAGGTVSGFLAGLVGTGGAVRGITIAAFQLPKEVFIATSAIIDLGVDASRSIIYVYNGYFPRNLVLLVPFLMGIGLVGSYVGKLLLRYISEQLFRYIVVVTIVATALLQLIKYIT